MSKYIFIPNGGEAVEAEYIEQMIEEYRGNPFIEALPPIYSKDEVVDKLVVYPNYNSKERMLDSHLRVHMVQRLFQCFQPLQVHLDLESRISRVMRQGYLARNPFRPEYAASLQDGYRMIQNLNLDLCSNKRFRTTAAGFTIIGVSGMGKTTAVNRILATMPQIIVHSEYRGVKFSMCQLVWLKLDCPYDGSIKGLCMEFFSKVDSLLGTDYYKKHVTGRHTVDSMLSIMSQVARHTGLGMLVIDEIQHLRQAKSGGSEKMLNFFVTLVNTIGVPVVLIGTTKAMSVLQSEFRQARRGSGQGDMVWERLQKDSNWDLLMGALWDYQWTKKEVPFTPEISDVMYEESQGIIDIAVKLYAMAQIRAIYSGIEEVNAGLIRQVAQENLKLVHPMIEALKSGDFRRISQFEDISTVDFEEFISSERPKYSSGDKIQELLIKKKQKESADTLSLKERAVLKLLDLDIDPQKAQKVVEEIINQEEQDINVSEVVIKAVQILTGIAGKKTLVKKNKAELRDENDLRVIVEEGKMKQMSAYEALKAKGIIKTVENDFFQAG
ncbi:ATP-binding protein [Clostridium cochlearium]|uniref:ATP-binding protein n=1 Tax=Clostridium cochlearium TaxID=1494 RepID=UPI00241CCECF|nr:ATP-binding protein [Clostridium cochlearium]MBE6064979.1 ATP-binding protein [Clostridium cochlearium]